MSKNLTTEEFIERAIKIHGDLYEYFPSKYKGSHKIIKISCKKHGIFEQIPNSHLSGKGCRDCAIEKRNKNLMYDTEIFIAKAQKVHNNKYSYPNSIYLGSSFDIEINCPSHGSFWQKAGNHLFGQKCGDCSKNKKSNTQKFIQKAIRVHGDLYLYFKIKYDGSKKDVEIVCQKHDSFWQRPNNHLNGAGCPDCKKEKMNLILKNDIQYFIERASIIHNNKYSYLLMEYKNNKFKIDIICLEHNIFKQTPSSHLNGRGCPNCSNKISKPEIQWLDSLNILSEFRQFKIKINGKLYKVDGYEPETNTILEFLGNIWHGNPKIYDPNGINPISKKSFGELYTKTMERINLFKENGYNVFYIWEDEYINLIKQQKNRI